MHNFDSRAQDSRRTTNVRSIRISTNFSLAGAPAGPVLYAYDELGRLVQVTDPSGDLAIYRYDAVGNITAIERPGANVISISDFTPNGGPVGTVVTIDGSGFSTTPSQNVVKFNGTNAVVTSATATQIATTVPAGSSDGTITVTVGTITGTSLTPFDVTTATTPTVTGFSPTTAASGTAVTVNGTNFETVPGNDNLRLNLSPSQVASATTTAIQTTVPPSATTGRVSVATPNGTGVSANYLWIAPPPYLLPALGPTISALLNADIPVSSVPIDQIALLAFEGTESQRIAVNVTGVNGSANVQLYTPFGAVIKTLTVVGSGFLDTVTLRWTGTYSVVFDPLTSAPMAGTFHIFDVPADFTSPIAFSTPLLVPTVGQLAAGQNARLTFTGTAGHRLSLDESGFNCFASNTSILAPGGAVLATTCAGTFIEPSAPLAVTGTYTVLVDPKDASTGSTTLTLYDVPADGTGTLAINDPSTTVSLQTPGQNAFYTFSGSNAQSIRVQLGGGITGTFPCVTMSLLRPNGTGGFTQLTQSSGCGGFDFTYTLPAADTYTIKIDPIGNSKGSATVRVISPP
jgi:YD repeat-containing protein